MLRFHAQHLLQATSNESQGL
jgi:hypothetical protein